MNAFSALELNVNSVRCFPYSMGGVAFLIKESN